MESTRSKFTTEEVRKALETQYKTKSVNAKLRAICFVAQHDGNKTVDYNFETEEATGEGITTENIIRGMFDSNSKDLYIAYVVLELDRIKKQEEIQAKEAGE